MQLKERALVDPAADICKGCYTEETLFFFAQIGLNFKVLWRRGLMSLLSVLNGTLPLLVICFSTKMAS